MTAVTAASGEARTTGHLYGLVDRRFQRSVEIPARFFAVHADLVSRACLDMARRFQRGGRLLVFGEGAEATDAQHVAVEFVHPVIVGKRALPAIALTSDVALLTGLARGGESSGSFTRVLQILGREQDIAMGISRDAGGPSILSTLTAAQELGMLTIGLTGQCGMASRETPVDFAFAVPSDDPLVVQEVHETLYHVLWELVHIFFEHRVVT